MNRKVMFIAYQDQENLGVGYLSSVLLSKGFAVETLDIRLGRDEILQRIRNADPLIVGFSLIFQYHTFMFRELMSYLRENGINCHFTIGGHYPSLRFDDVLNIMPEMDSVVRFEGELTICELAESLSAGRDWRALRGIAYRVDGKPVSNELRPLISDLDTLPFPLRNKQSVFQCMGKNYATLIASRGCVRNCSFCSIRKFYQTPPGKVRRSRSPRNVVEEMKDLYGKYDSRVFLFQDDDFIFPGRLGREWVRGFIGELESKGLANNILWKVSCRTDEVDVDLLREMKEAGLFLVYLGLESGNQAGLETLNKQVSVEDNLRAIESLKGLDINYEFGFMLFDPYSTFDSVRTNIHFLEKVCGDGSSPAVFVKVVPLAETDIEKRLRDEGRLKGSVINPDYDFLDPRLDRCCEFVLRTFREWISDQKGMLAQLRWHRLEVAILRKFYPHAEGIPEYEKSLRGIIADSNKLFFNIAEKAATICEEDSADAEDRLQELAKLQLSENERINSELFEGMVEFHRRQQ